MKLNTILLFLTTTGMILLTGLYANDLKQQVFICAEAHGRDYQLATCREVGL